MKQLPLVLTYSEYHAVIVPLVTVGVFLIGGSFHDMIVSLSTNLRWLLAFIATSVALALTFWIGIAPGHNSAQKKQVAISSLLLVQITLGSVIAFQSLESGSVLGQAIGSVMFALGMYRIILIRFHKIDESYFEDFDLATTGALLSFSIGAVLVLTAFFGVEDLFVLSFAYLAGDVLTSVRIRS